ncbi:MAG: dTMP kinase [Thermoplasmata archaeon M11B2D]|nr:MAG: dTMP kinase [Thermoplasmata archaeon M11B2D]PNX50557.1 MAG: dTMP kinase [Thermoplasmata archaeon M9B2D]
MKHFVTFEGIDGSGKSTISKRVCEKLRLEGYETIWTFEPTDSTIGKFVQECIKKQSDPFVTSFAFIADRIQHCKQITEWLDKGNIVVCDRYAESTYAYQAVQLQTKLSNPLKWLQELSSGRILIPDRTFLFVIDPQTALARIQHRAELIPFEKLAFLEKVHKNYLTVSKGKRFLHLDATKPIEELVELCYDDILR